MAENMSLADQAVTAMAAARVGEGMSLLGMKIALTGLIVMIVAWLSIFHIGKWPGLALGLPLVVAFLGGGLAAVAGALVAIWAA